MAAQGRIEGHPAPAQLHHHHHGLRRPVGRHPRPDAADSQRSRLGSLAGPGRTDRRRTAAGPWRPGPDRHPAGVDAGQQRSQQRPGTDRAGRIGERTGRIVLTRFTGPLRSDDVVDAIGADLRAAGYTTDGVADLLGADASAALERGVWWPAVRATQTATADRQPLAVAVRLFLLGSDEPRELVETALPSARL